MSDHVILEPEPEPEPEEIDEKCESREVTMIGAPDPTDMGGESPCFAHLFEEPA